MKSKITTERSEKVLGFEGRIKISCIALLMTVVGFCGVMHDGQIRRAVQHTQEVGPTLEDLKAVLERSLAAADAVKEHTGYSPYPHQLYVYSEEALRLAFLKEVMDIGYKTDVIFDFVRDLFDERTQKACLDSRKLEIINCNQLAQYLNGFNADDARAKSIKRQALRGYTDSRISEILEELDRAGLPVYMDEYSNVLVPGYRCLSL